MGLALEAECSITDRLWSRLCKLNTKRLFYSLARLVERMNSSLLKLLYLVNQDCVKVLANPVAPTATRTCDVVTTNRNLSLSGHGVDVSIDSIRLAVSSDSNVANLRHGRADSLHMLRQTIRCLRC